MKIFKKKTIVITVILLAVAGVVWLVFFRKGDDSSLGEKAGVEEKHTIEKGLALWCGCGRNICTDCWDRHTLEKNCAGELCGSRDCQGTGMSTIRRMNGKLICSNCLKRQF